MIPIKDENPTETFPWITIGLIAVNIVVFIYQISLGIGSAVQEQFIYTYSLIPYEITHGINLHLNLPDLSYLSILTSMFLHGGIVHIVGNMLYLWIFGNNVEDTLGHLKFLLFYIVCGLAGATGHIISSPNSQIPTLGASGAIAGVLGAYLILFPRAKVITIIPIFYFIEIVRIPALIVIGVWFLLQLVSGVASITAQPAIDAGGVAWFAHIGGFIAGMLLILLVPKHKKLNVL